MTKRRLRVAHVITRLCVGGAQENTFQTVRLADKTRFDVDLISGPVIDPGEESIAARIEAAGIPIIWVPSLRRNISPWHDLIALIHLTRLFQTRRYDLVHTHTSKAGFLGRLAARLARVSMVVHTPHGNVFDGYFSRALTRVFIGLERFAARYTDILIELTPRGIQEHLDHNIGRTEQWRCVFSGIDCETFQEGRRYREQVRAEWNVTPEEVVVGGVGRLEPVKGFAYFVEAAQLVLETFPKTRFVLVGDGSEREVLKTLARGLGDRFRFLGFRKDVPRVMSGLDILVVPSVNEGMGRVVLEAGAAGLPVVASAVGGIPDILLDGKTGILVPPKDSVALAEAIQRLIQDHALRFRMGADAMAYVTPRFSVDAMVIKIEELYEELARTTAADS